MMRDSSTTAAIAATAILALLLIAYVFVGGSPGGTDRAPHCPSQQALEQVKAELFRRAAAVRGTTDASFDAVEKYSVLRAGSRLVRRHHRGSDKVTCTGSLVLDLPPGAAVAGGRHSIASRVAYDLAPQSGGAVRLMMLSKADDLVVPLATVSNALGQAGQAPAAPPQPNEQQANGPPPPPVQIAPPPFPTRPRPQAPTEPPKKAAPNRQAPAPPPAKPPAKPPATARPVQPAPSAVAAAKPSFNCRYAKTSGEIAVCGNPALASLDRQMSAQFYSALAAARPGQRAMLQRSRNRFLHYRDSCASEACIADADRGRIAEINAIMAGRW